MPSTGAGTLATTGSFASWPSPGYARIVDNAGALREIVYYTERTSTSLTVPAGGRGLLGTSSSAGAADDTVYAVPGIRIAGEAPTGNQFSIASNENDVPTGLAWTTGISRTDGVMIGDMAAGELYGLWLRLQVPAGARGNPEMENGIDWSFEAG